MRAIYLLFVLSLVACGSDAKDKSSNNGGANNGGANNGVSTGGLGDAYRGSVSWQLKDPEGFLIDQESYERQYIWQESANGQTEWVNFFGDEDSSLIFDPSDSMIPPQRPQMDESLSVTGGTWSVSGTTLTVELVGTSLTDDFTDELTEYTFTWTFEGQLAEGGRYPLVDQPLEGTDNGTDYADFGGFAETNGTQLHIELHPGQPAVCDASNFAIAPFFISLNTSPNEQDEENASYGELIYLYMREADSSGGGSESGRVVIEEITDDIVKGSVVIDDESTYLAGTFEVPMCSGMQEALGFNY